MILYFSGTGNSAYAAKRIGRAIGDEVVNLFPMIRRRDYSELNSDSPWVLVVPTYAWRIPRIVQEWLERTRLGGNEAIYFVLTCGGSAGNAGKYLAKLCAIKKMNYMGSRAIVMPENYIALFTAPDAAEASAIIRRAESVMDDAARLIKNGEFFPRAAVTFGDRINSGMVNRLFYPVFVHAKKFYADERCISCGKCAEVCPLNNVRLENGKPAWGKVCTHCMACICRCPRAAIEYGKHTKGLLRYVCPKTE